MYQSRRIEEQPLECACSQYDDIEDRKKAIARLEERIETDIEFFTVEAMGKLATALGNPDDTRRIGIGPDLMRLIIKVLSTREQLELDCKDHTTALAKQLGCLDFLSYYINPSCGLLVSVRQSAATLAVLIAKHHADATLVESLAPALFASLSGRNDGVVPYTVAVLIGLCSTAERKKALVIKDTLATAWRWHCQHQPSTATNAAIIKLLLVLTAPLASDADATVTNLESIQILVDTLKDTSAALALRFLAVQLLERLAVPQHAHIIQATLKQDGVVAATITLFCDQMEADNWQQGIGTATLICNYPGEFWPAVLKEKAAVQGLFTLLSHSKIVEEQKALLRQKTLPWLLTNRFATQCIEAEQAIGYFNDALTACLDQTSATGDEDAKGDEHEGAGPDAVEEKASKSQLKPEHYMITMLGLVEKFPEQGPRFQKIIMTESRMLRDLAEFIYRRKDNKSFFHTDEDRERYTRSLSVLQVKVGASLCDTGDTWVDRKSSTPLRGCEMQLSSQTSSRAAASSISKGSG